MTALRSQIYFTASTLMTVIHDICMTRLDFLIRWAVQLAEKGEEIHGLLLLEDHANDTSGIIHPSIWAEEEEEDQEGDVV